MQLNPANTVINQTKAPAFAGPSYVKCKPLYNPMANFDVLCSRSSICKLFYLMYKFLVCVMA